MLRPRNEPSAKIPGQSGTIVFPGHRRDNSHFSGTVGNYAFSDPTKNNNYVTSKRDRHSTQMMVLDDGLRNNDTSSTSGQCDL